MVLSGGSLARTDPITITQAAAIARKIAVLICPCPLYPNGASSSPLSICPWRLARTLALPEPRPGTPDQAREGERPREPLIEGCA